MPDTPGVFYDELMDKFLPKFIVEIFGEDYRCFAHRLFVEICETYTDEQAPVYQDQALAIEVLCSTMREMQRNKTRYVGSALNQSLRDRQGDIICKQIVIHPKRSFEHLKQLSSQRSYKRHG